MELRPCPVGPCFEFPGRRVGGKHFRKQRECAFAVGRTGRGIWRVGRSDGIDHNFIDFEQSHKPFNFVGCLSGAANDPSLFEHFNERHITLRDGHRDSLLNQQLW